LGRSKYFATVKNYKRVLLMGLSDVLDKPGHLIRRCQQIAVALFLERCAPFDLMPMQYAILRGAEAEPGLDQISLAGLVALDRSNAARVCAVLESRGLLRRSADPSDRRARRLFITPRGKLLLEQAEPAVLHLQEELLAPLTANERKAFVTALRKIALAHNDISRAPVRRTNLDEVA
jgi:DNA-binding MarR family transcriptional regulator